MPTVAGLCLACHGPLGPSGGVRYRSRPRLYCSPSCKQAATRMRTRGVGPSVQLLRRRRLHAALWAALRDRRTPEEVGNPDMTDADWRR